MPRLPLTEQEKEAVGASLERLFIEAAPGAGKTTVAAERYGVLRYIGSSRSRRSITAVSFTRSATGELYRQVRGRWGSTALMWPHAVITIDTLICNMVEHLLREGVIQWPGGHRALEVLDDWRGHRGYRWLPAGSYRRVGHVDDSGLVTSQGRLMRDPGLAIGSRADFHHHLENGLCTHEVVRQVLAGVLRQPARRGAVADYLSSSMAHLVVDEVFDANRLDLELVDLACESDIAVTLVGDPWQALYGFRGARPESVPGVLTRWGFDSLPLSHSFRFQSEEMRTLGAELRDGRPVALTGGEDYDVVLGSQWDDLWQASERVLPLSFGRTANKTDAAAIVLLDHLVYGSFGQHAIFLPEALVLLSLDREIYRTEGARALGRVVEILSGPGDEAPVRALAALRQSMKDLGAQRRPPTGRGDSEQRQIDRMAALAVRVRSGGRLVPGMTIHQAKGREWDRVGVKLRESDIQRLANGLDSADEGDRALYVALTRAKYTVRKVA
jgi:DNA helicase-2/ATP-dependent DNA helicase PcrA